MASYEMLPSLISKGKENIADETGWACSHSCQEGIKESVICEQTTLSQAVSGTGILDLIGKVTLG